LKFLFDLLSKGFAFAYHGAVNLFLLVLGGNALATKQFNLVLPMFPVSGEPLANMLIVTGGIGLLTLLLALSGRFVYAFPVYCLLFAVQAFRWVIFPGKYVIGSMEGFAWWAALVAGAIGAFLCSLVLLKRKALPPAEAKSASTIKKQ
jgi:hypothetical protein